MPRWIQKLSESGGQYRLTIPKDVIKISGLENAKVVEIWAMENQAIIIKEYNGKEKRKV